MTQALVIFDVDGTLLDSQGHILSRVEHAFQTCGLPAPARHDVLARVGLSLELMMETLAGADAAPDLAEQYRAAPVQSASCLYPGTADMLRALHARSDVVLAVATGKSRRGLAALIDEQGWGDLFVSLQTADTNPSKPHPAMIQTILTETGIAPARCAMVGDTSFDIDMGRAAGVGTIAVPWGFHDPADLNADAVLTAWSDLPATLDHLWEAHA